MRRNLFREQNCKAVTQGIALNYQTTLQYLYSLTDYEKERIARYDPATLDLSRVRRVLACLGDPHKRFRSIHIAGTKGKGSVAAVCASVLQTAGVRTGLYTSPHLHTFRERMAANNKPLHANLEFYKGLIYRVAGLPDRFFTATSWTAWMRRVVN